MELFFFAVYSLMSFSVIIAIICGVFLIIKRKVISGYVSRILQIKDKALVQKIVGLIGAVVLIFSAFFTLALIGHFMLFLSFFSY